MGLWSAVSKAHLNTLSLVGGGEWVGTDKWVRRYTHIAPQSSGSKLATPLLSMAASTHRTRPVLAVRAVLP